MNTMGRAGIDARPDVQFRYADWERAALAGGLEEDDLAIVRGLD